MTNFNEHEFASGHSLMVWWPLPCYIYWKLEQRRHLKEDYNDNVLNGLRISTIMDCCAYIEGVMDYMLRNILYVKWVSNENKYYLNLILREEERLENAQWNNYKEMFELAINKKLKEKIPAQLYESINVLFVFRNMLAHGKELEINFYRKKNGDLIQHITRGRYEQIYNHLKIYGKLKIVEGKELDPDDFLTDKVIDYFFKMTLQFIKKIVKLPGKNERSYFEDSVIDSINHYDYVKDMKALCEQKSAKKIDQFFS